MVAHQVHGGPERGHHAGDRRGMHTGSAASGWASSRLRDVWHLTASMLRCVVEHVPGCRWASITDHQHRTGVSLASSDPVAAQADAIQHRLGTGPCLPPLQPSCLPPDLENDQRWSGFGHHAVTTTPARSMLSFGLTGSTTQALNLYADHPHAFNPAAVNMVIMIAAHASTFTALAHQSRDGYQTVSWCSVRASH